MSRNHNAYRTGFAIQLDDGDVLMWVDGQMSWYTSMPPWARASAAERIQQMADPGRRAGRYFTRRDEVSQRERKHQRKTT